MDHRLRLAASTAIIIVLASQSVHAQTSSTDDGAQGRRGGDEIIVTATRRAQSILDVPQSIQAIGGDAIEDLVINNVEDVVSLVPNLNIETNRKFGGRFNIRGFGDQEGAFTAFSTVGIYIDDTPLTDARANFEAGLFDIERIEVLRGPQGTLYGEGSLAGTVRIITNKPNVDEYSASLLGRVETTKDGEESYRVGGVVNVPLVKGKAALRVTGSYDDAGGFMDSGPWPTGAPVTEDVNGGSSVYVRAALQFNPTDAISIRPSFTYESVDAQAGPIDSIALPDLVGYSNGPDSFEDELSVFALEADIDFGWATLTSSTSYYDRTFDSIDDDLQANTIIDLFIAPSAFTTQTFMRETQTFSQELRLVSAADGPLTWLIGGFYRDKELKEDTLILSETIGLVAGDERTFFQDNAATFRQIAFFGEANYALNEKLTVTGGLRWFDEDASSALNFGVFDLGVFGFVLNPEITPDFSENGVLFKGAATYEVSDDITLYALYSEGYRPGGVNDRLADIGGMLTAEQLAALGTYQRDETSNYEVGLKSRLFDGRVAFNATAFYIDWSGTQVSSEPIPGANVVVNAEGADSIGFETDLMVHVTDRLTFGAAAGYAKAEISADTASASGVIPEGSALPHAPKFSGNAYLEYRHPLSNAIDARFRIDTRYTGARQNRVDIVGLSGAPLDEYNIVNALVGIEGEDWSANLYVNNLTNELAELNSLLFDDGTIGNVAAGFVRNRPRTFGLQVRKDF